jgi:hypothetical protein
MEESMREGIIPSNKICSVCKTEQPIENFRKQEGYPCRGKDGTSISGRGKYGRNARCKSCESDYNKKKFKIDFAQNPEKYWAKALIRDHHITLEQYQKRLSDQNGVCAICFRPPRKLGRKHRLVIDHDHRCCNSIQSCGKCIRGLICQSCNVALGLMSDNPTNFRSAAQYLENNRKEMEGQTRGE